VTIEQKCALARLRQAAGGILPHVASRAGRRDADVTAWLAELGRGPIAYARVRTIAGALRVLGTELERDAGPPELTGPASSLIDAAEQALSAF
jgi:hypothetical protein